MTQWYRYQTRKQQTKTNRRISRPLLLLSLLMIVLLPTTTPTSATERVRFPFPRHTSYAPDTISPNHRSQTQQDDDIRTLYDYWKALYLIHAGTAADGSDLYRIAYGADQPDSDRTVSEGQGYGMIITAFMAGHEPQAQAIFDGLWKFAGMHPSQIDNRLMDWDVPDATSGNDSAFDGDADMAYALLLADKQWGSNGAINYRSNAETLVTAILQSTIGPDSRLPELGDWVNPNGSTYNQYTPRSSDFMPAHFRAYGRMLNDPVWSEVISNTQSIITNMQTQFSPGTGLLPDFIVPVSSTDHSPRPAPADFLEGSHDGDYYYNAGRVPWRLAVDGLLNNDPNSLAQAGRISVWAETAAEGNPDNIKAGYKLNGTPLAGSNYFTTFFAAPLGVAAMTVPSQQSWLNSVYDAVYSRHEGYYEDSVNLLCLLVMSGNYWDPSTVKTVNTTPLSPILMLLLSQ